MCVIRRACPHDAHAASQDRRRELPLAANTRDYGHRWGVNPKNPEQQEIIRTLIAMGVGKLVLESRNATHDKRDVELLVSMRRRGEATEFDMEHVPGSSEPLLWVPDQILGAYGEVVTKGANRRWDRTWERLSEHANVREVSAR